MRKTLYIFSLLLGIFLLLPEEEVQHKQTVINAFVEQESVLLENGEGELQQQIVIICNDLQDCNGLALRRSSQTNSQITPIRLLRTSQKNYHLFCLKKTNLLRKVLEEVNTYQTISYSTLLCRMGYHVFGLRKILI